GSIKLESGNTMAVCVNLMIRLGDPDCGAQVSEYVDYRKVGSVFTKAGLEKTILSGTKAKTTSADMTVFLSGLHGDGFHKNAQKVLLKSLREQGQRRGIPAACPGCLVSNEATDNGVVHDAAIIEYGDGTYVL